VALVIARAIPAESGCDVLPRVDGHRDGAPFVLDDDMILVEARGILRDGVELPAHRSPRGAVTVCAWHIATISGCAS
jgi:hypothetical protein